MECEQIAHDLAIAKLYGSDKQTKDLIAEYHQYYNEFLSALKSEPRTRRSADIMHSPM
jgi:hypothetical protein